MTFGVCAGCGAVAWELLNGVSDYCIGCDSASYQPPDECCFCDCDGSECYAERSEVRASTASSGADSAEAAS